MRKIFLYIGGSVTLLFSIFHILFWELFNWSEELFKLSPENRGTFQMLNVASIYVLFFGAFISFHLAKRKESHSFVEKSLIIFLAGYYLLRVVFSIPFYGFSIGELVIWFFCASVASCYLISIIKPHSSSWISRREIPPYYKDESLEIRQKVAGKNLKESNFIFPMIIAKKFVLYLTIQRNFSVPIMLKQRLNPNQAWRYPLG